LDCYKVGSDGLNLADENKNIICQLVHALVDFDEMAREEIQIPNPQPQTKLGARNNVPNTNDYHITQLFTLCLWTRLWTL